MVNDIFPIYTPRVNPNEDSVTVMEWSIGHGEKANAGDVVCTIETAKAVIEVNAEISGILYHRVKLNDVVAVGGCIGLIGPSVEAVEEYIKKEEKEKISEKESGINATPKARALAEENGIDLKDISAGGVQGTIKETDVERYINNSGAGGKQGSDINEEVLKYSTDEGGLSPYDTYMANNLSEANHNILMATLTSEMNLEGIRRFIGRKKQEGLMVGLVHIILCAVHKAIKENDRLTLFQINNHVFKYKEIKTAFIVKAYDERIYAPILSGADISDIECAAKKSQSLTLRANRHELKQEEMEGACFTVSHLPNDTVKSFAALINRNQSAVLAVSGENIILKMQDGEVKETTVVNLTLSYDHKIIDGWYAAKFLECLKEEIEKIINEE